MRLTSLHLTQFRNYPSLALDVREGDVHLFVGPNASGKTNLLDAVCVLSQERSALGLSEEDLVSHDAEFYRIRGTVRSDAGEEGTLETVSQIRPRRQKACFHNDVRVPVSRMVGALPTIIFLPQDLSLFTGAPADRRSFLDQILTQVSPAYYRALGEYQKLLKQRNALLKRIASSDAKERELEPWDGEIAEKGSTLTVARLELIETFSLALRDELRTLGEAWHDVKIRYERAGLARDAAALASEIRALLVHARNRDIILQSTTVGPHRDDWHVLADGFELERVASRGQQRSAVLALLFLEASYVELRRGEKPVILLDDILSELDDRHQERVLGAFPGHQVLLTATHLPPGIAGATVWAVREGKIDLASF